jgi:hypothetical protein
MMDLFYQALRQQNLDQVDKVLDDNCTQSDQQSDNRTQDKDELPLAYMLESQYKEAAIYLQFIHESQN